MNFVAGVGDGSKQRKNNNKNITPLYGCACVWRMGGRGGSVVWAKSDPRLSGGPFPFT